MSIANHISDPVAAANLGGGFSAIEFFAGIGGFSTAWPACRVEWAIDVNELAARTYRRNHSHKFLVAEIESLTSEFLRAQPVDLWWLSPPCQPYSQRGKQRDIDDPRARSLLHILDLITACRPPVVCLENVPGFSSSRAFHRLSHTLEAGGYNVQTLELCPTQLGWPNRRQRFYLLASQTAIAPWRNVSPCPISLRDLGIPRELRLSEAKLSELWLNDRDAQRYFSAMDRVDAADASAFTACFASSYGKTLIHSGSYVLDRGGYRRFTPGEVATLLGYPPNFSLDHLSPRQAWKLLGNSLSIPAVRYLLSHLPQGTQP